MAKTDLILDALVTDAVGISPANGYVTTMQRVYTERVAPEAVEPQGLILYQAELEVDVEEMGVLRPIANQDYDFILYVQGDDPFDLLRKAVDDLRNAWEKQTSAVRAVADVSSVIVVFVEQPLLTGGDVTTQKGIVGGTVRVRYTYRRGSV